MQDIIRLSEEAFDLDLESCLTILDYPTKEKPYYVCEYISPSLYKKIVKVITFKS